MMSNDMEIQNLVAKGVDVWVSQLDGTKWMVWNKKPNIVDLEDGQRRLEPGSIYAASTIEKLITAISQILGGTENSTTVHEMRTKRNKLLKETDHFAIEDYPLSKGRRTAIKAYRQALRDVPQTNAHRVRKDRPVFVTEPWEWPEKPDFVA